MRLWLKEGLLLAQHVSKNRLIIQSDCMEVVETMKDGGFSANLAAAIYDKLKRTGSFSLCSAI
jgi:hypothetical protein